MDIRAVLVAHDAEIEIGVVEHIERVARNPRQVGGLGEHFLDFNRASVGALAAQLGQHPAIRRQFGIFDRGVQLISRHR